MKNHILIVEDDPDIVILLKHSLSAANLEVSVAASGSLGLSLAESKNPQLIILDLMLPGLDGLEVCKKLKRNSKTARIPILILTAKAGETDKVVGLELGADDYVTKPFSPRELLARVKVLLRRFENKEAAERLYRHGQLTLDTEKHEVSYAGKALVLTSKEFGLLEALLRNAGKALTRQALLDQVWGDDFYGGSRTVDVHIRKLREKIPQISSDIITIKGLGYKLKAK